jgi:hypothetical protein
MKMRKLNWLTLGALAVAFAAGCNPYSKENTGAPSIVAITAADLAGGTPTPGASGANGWTIEGIPSTCAAGTPTSPSQITSAQPVFFVTFNKVMDGRTIETTTTDPVTKQTVTDCTPASSWLTVTPAAPEGMAWYSCYTPSSASPDWGGSIVIFRAPAGGQNGWASFAPTEAQQAANTTYTVKGTVKDMQGHAIAIDFTAMVAPAVGNVTNVAPTGGTSTTVQLSWEGATACSDGATVYSVRRVDASGNETEVGKVPFGTTTFTDNASGLTADALQSYAVYALTTEVTTKGQTGVKPIETQVGAFDNVVVGLAAPVVAAPPAYVAETTSTPAEVDLTWTASTGADSYDVRRAAVTQGPNGVAITGAYNTLASKQTALTYKDTTVSGGVTYVYVVVPRKSITPAGATAATVGFGAYSPTTTVVVAPSAPDQPSFVNVGPTSVTLSWAQNIDVTSWDVFRAPDNAGKPGTFPATPLANVLAPADKFAPAVTYTDATVSAGTTYWYELVAHNANANPSLPSDPLSVKAAGAVAPVAPAAPKFGTVTDVLVQVVIQTVTGASSYDVQRSTDGTTFTTVGTADPATGAFVDTGLTAATKYYYQVTATNSSGSATSASASITTAAPTLPAAPIEPRFVAVASTSVTVEYTLVGFATSYQLQRAPDVNGAPGTFAPVGAAKPAPADLLATFDSIADGTVTTGTTYWYRVDAKDAAGTTPGVPAAVATP